MFSSQVIERSQQMRLAAPEETASVFELEIRQGEAEFSGKLLLREPSGRITGRELAGASCDEVVAALALIAAVMIDPTADPTTGTTTSVTSRDAPPGVSRSSRESTSAHRRREPRERLARAGKRSAPASNAVPQATRWSFGVGLGFALEDAVVPEVAPGLAAELDAEYAAGGALRPLFALQLTRTLTEDVATNAGTAELTWTAARLLGCPLAWPAEELFALRPCAAFEAGLLDATGTDTSRQATSSAPWFALGAGARIEFRPARRLRLALDGGAVFPLRRDRFYFAPATAAFEVPAVGASVRLALLVGLD